MAVNKTLYTQAVAEVNKLQMEAIDQYVSDIADMVGDVGNPEELIGAPYEEWKDNPMILQQLQMIYGTQEPNPLSELIFKKEITRIREQEAALGGF